jgi:hypothetical protein
MPLEPPAGFGIPEKRGSAGPGEAKRESSGPGEGI